jgi:hypothetical protein
VLLALFYRPWPGTLSGTLPKDVADPALNLWALRWIEHTLFTNPTEIFDTNIYWPELGTLTYSEPVLPLGIAFAVIRFVVRDPVIAYNLLTIALGGLAFTGGYLLAHRLTGRRDAAVLAAIAVTFNGYVFSHQSQIQLLTTGLLAIVALLFLRVLERPTILGGVGLGVAIATTATSSLYYGAVLAVALVGMGLAALVLRRVSLRTVAALASAGVVAAIFVAPVALRYDSVHEAELFDRPVEPGLALDTEDFVTPQFDSWLYDGLSDRLLEANFAAEHAPNEHIYFVGFVTLLLAGVGGVALVTRRSAGREVAIVLAGGAAAALVAYGVKAGGITMPYHYLREWSVPGFDGIRAPVRFASFTVLALAALAAFGFAAIARRTPRRAPVIAGILAVVLVLELWAPYPRANFSVDDRNEQLHRTLARDAQGAVLELPIPDPRIKALGWPFVEAPRMVMSTYDWRPRINGYSGFWPRGYLERAAAFNEFPSPRSLALLEILQVTHVVLRVGPSLAGFPQLTAAGAQKIVDELPACADARRFERDWLVELCATG